jgi:3-(3-hydroxy-phenyl)propionate hydroxylase
MPGIQHSDYDVVIVGCGPTGATLGNLLAISGLSVLILEREKKLYDLPRAVHFDDETMRVFQTVGIADELKPLVRINPGMRFVDSNNTILLDWPRPQTITNQGWNASYRLHQPDLESLLRSAIKKQPRCTLLTGRKVIGIQQKPHSISVSYEFNGAGKTHVTASYVVGCDGANSFVRNSLDIPIEDLGYRERWLVVDILLKRELPHLGDHTIQYCDSTQPMTYCRNPGLRRRWEMALPDSVTDSEAKNDTRIWALLSRWIGAEDAIIERKAVYTFRSAIASTWQHKRVAIAGDAAHLTPPFMGQGMCAGIRDASNLAWKVAFCVKHGHNDALVNSYTLERRPHVLQYIRTAIKLGQLINSIDQSSAHKFGPSKGEGNHTMASITPRLGDAQLTGSLDHRSENSGVLSRQPLLINGTKLDDYCGYAPVLLVRCIASIPSMENIPICCLSGEDHPAVDQQLDELRCNAVLIRPDRYVLGVANSVEEIQKLVDGFSSLQTSS